MQSRLLPLLAFTLAPVAAGQTTFDVNAQSQVYSSTISNAQLAFFGAEEEAFVPVGDGWVFRATTAPEGSELWFTDGTAAGTHLIRDIAPGDESSTPFQMAVLGDRVFFTAQTAAEGLELWVSDGTEAGTSLLEDIQPGPGSSFPANLTTVNGMVLFSADDGVHGKELWSTDGTHGSTQLVRDIRVGGESSPHYFSPGPDGTTVWFEADDGVHGKELWRSDGTAAGTQLVADINPGGFASYPRDLYAWNGRMYFRAETASVGSELFVSDGTAAGTQLLADIVPGPAPSVPTMRDATEYMGQLYFLAWGPSGGELYRTDGTVVTLAADLNPIGNGKPAGMVVHNGLLHFIARNDSGPGRVPWVFDGQTASVVKDLDPNGQEDSFFLWEELTPALGKLWFQGTDGQSGYEPWVTDGTAAGTQRVADIAPGLADSFPTHFTQIDDGHVIFAAETPQSGRELWISDGTAAGTSLLLDLTPYSTSGSGDPRELVSPDGRGLVFSANDGVFGRELYRWDAVGGAQLVLDVSPLGNGLVHDLTVAWDGSAVRTFFSADDGTHGEELWVTDGTAAGTQLVRDIKPGTNGSRPDALVASGTRLFFNAEEAGGKRRLFVSDGTAQGTRPLTPKAVGSFGASFAFEGGLLFAAEGANGVELWRTDGTSAGTLEVADVFPGLDSSDPEGFVRLGDRVAFVATGLGTGRELWITDGTAVGTTLLADVVPGPTGSQVEELAAWQGKLFFAATDGAGSEPWMFDPEVGVAQRLVELMPGGAGSEPAEFVASGAGLYFVATDPLAGRHVWLTQGIPGDPVRVSGLAMSDEGAEPEGLTAAGRGVYYQGSGQLGRELYYADDLEAGLVFDFAVGASSSLPHELLTVDGQLAFVATDPFFGIELRSLPLTRATVFDLGASADGIALQGTPPVLGQTFEVRVEGVPANAPGALLMGPANSAAIDPLLAAGHATWIAPNQAVVAALLMGSPTVTRDVPVPATPALAGLTLHVQAYFLPGAALPARSSNGLFVRLGD